MLVAAPTLAQLTTQGEPAVGNTLGTKLTTSQAVLDATMFTGADMCASIAAACAQLSATSTTYPAGATIDARGFTGNQVCKAGNITTMLFQCVPPGTGTNGATGGKLLLGEVNLYADGPTANAYYTDLNGSTYGTPALIIPAGFWGIEGLSRGADAGTSGAPGVGTFLSVCTGSGTPVTNCTTAFPQRTFAISQISVSGSNPTTMTVTISGSVTVYAGELAMVRGQGTTQLPPPNGDNGMFAVQSFTVVGGTTQIKVTVPPSTPGCTSTCGTLILGTPIVGFGPGGMGTGGTGNFYNTTNCGNPASCSAFGMHIKNLGFNCQGGAPSPATIQGCIGWQNLYAQEESGADTFLIDNFNFVGFDTHGNNAQNFGPILNAEIYTGGANSNCDYGTTGGYIDGVTMRGLDGWTINTPTGSGMPSTANCGHTPNAAVILDATDTEIRHGHCQAFTDCVVMGANNANASGLRVTGVGDSNPVTNVVHISANNKSTVTDFMVENIQSIPNATNTLKDEITGITLTNRFLSLYSWSQPSGVGLNLVTTDTSIPNQFGSGLTASFTSVLITNNGTTAPVVNKLVKLTGAPAATATLATTSDTSGSVVGICLLNCSTTGSSTVVITGVVGCMFSNATTAGDWVIVSTGTNGDCKDTPTVSSTLTDIGRVLASGAANSVQNVLLQITR
jgi:hypothetical protein